MLQLNHSMKQSTPFVLLAAFHRETTLMNNVLRGGVSIIGSQIPAWMSMVSQIPIWMNRTVAIPLFFSLVIGLSGFFVRFPKSLTPRWYRRALKAGIPRNDPYIMGKFKALDAETQKALIQLHKEHTARTR